MNTQRTLPDILGEMFALQGVKDNIDTLKRAFAESDPDEIRETVGSAFAVLSVIINAAGADIMKTTGSFFLGLCGNDLAEAVAVLAEQKRRIDARAHEPARSDRKGAA